MRKILMTICLGVGPHGLLRPEANTSTHQDQREITGTVAKGVAAIGNVIPNKDASPSSSS